jgi:hypothetical protein
MIIVVVVVVVVVVTIQLQVESVMKDAVAAQPMETSELLSLQEVDLSHLAKASASMENNLRVRPIGTPAFYNWHADTLSTRCELRRRR